MGVYIKEASKKPGRLTPSFLSHNAQTPDI
jgi:hypothetical protein